MERTTQRGLLDEETRRVLLLRLLRKGIAANRTTEAPDAFRVEVVVLPFNERERDTEDTLKG